jgi:hypothetical protein
VRRPHIGICGRRTTMSALLFARKMSTLISEQTLRSIRLVDVRAEVRFRAAACGKEGLGVLALTQLLALKLMRRSVCWVVAGLNAACLLAQFLRGSSLASSSEASLLALGSLRWMSSAAAGPGYARSPSAPSGESPPNS